LPSSSSSALAEFDFRYNARIALGIGDGKRAALAVKGAEGTAASLNQSTNSNRRASSDDTKSEHIADMLLLVRSMIVPVLRYEISRWSEKGLLLPEHEHCTV
jgi:hypothetical protein